MAREFREVLGGVGRRKKYNQTIYYEKYFSPVINLNLLIWKELKRASVGHVSEQ